MFILWWSLSDYPPSCHWPEDGQALRALSPQVIERSVAVCNPLNGRLTKAQQDTLDFLPLIAVAALHHVGITGNNLLVYHVPADWFYVLRQDGLLFALYDYFEPGKPIEERDEGGNRNVTL